MEIVKKTWGHEKIIVNKEYCGKILVFEKGFGCSYHYHKLKDEVFYLQSGKILLKYGDDDDIFSGKELILTPGMSFHVYIGLRHQMVALEDSELFEFSSTHYDSDSYRVAPGIIPITVQ